MVARRRIPSNETPIVNVYLPIKMMLGKWFHYREVNNNFLTV